MDTTDLTPPKLDSIEETIKLTADTAACGHPFVIQKIVERSLDDTIPTKLLLDISDHLHKVSGMAKRQEVKEASDRVVLIIQRSSGAIRMEKDVTPVVEAGDTVEAEEVAAVLEQANVLAFGDFPECPEFGYTPGDFDG